MGKLPYHIGIEAGGKSHALGSEQAYYAFSLTEGAVAQETLRESVTDLPGEEASYEQNGVAISKAAYEQRRRAMSEPVETLYFDTKSDNSLQAGFPYDEALAYLNRIAAQSPSVGVKVNGAAVQWTDARPFIDENSRTMVPLRAVAEALGLNVRWDGERREAIFDDGAKTLYFPIGSSVARSGDGGAVQMDTAAVIVSDRTYAPVRYLAEDFGFSVGWDGAAKMVLISAGNR